MDQHDVYGLGFVMPFLQSVAAGLWSFVFTFFVVAWFVPIIQSLKLAGIVGGIFGMIVFGMGVDDWRKFIFFEDQPEVDPIEHNPHVRLEIQETKNKTTIAKFPVSTAKLVRLCVAIQKGSNFTESRFTGSGGLFTRSEFVKLRDEWLSRGLLNWNSPGTPARGVHVTSQGRAVVRHFASLEESPIPYPIDNRHMRQNLRH